MKLVDAQFKGQANSSEALCAKHDLLKQSIEQQVGKVESLKEALEEAKQAYTENDARTRTATAGSCSARRPRSPSSTAS